MQNEMSVHALVDDRRNLLRRDAHCPETDHQNNQADKDAHPPHAWRLSMPTEPSNVFK
jgi:hypothetical protein